MKAAFRAYILRRIWQKALFRIQHDQPYVITVTGTVGKTSAKEAIAVLLGLGKRPLVKSLGNMGSDVGLPLSLLGFEEQPRGLWEWFRAAFIIRPALGKKEEHPYYILEFSADRPGDIKFLTQRIPANAGVITAITPAHMANYPQLEHLEKEKFSLLDGVKKGGYAVLNADDPVIRNHPYTRLPVLWYGVVKGGAARRPGIWAHNPHFNGKGLEFELEFSAAKQLDTAARPAGKVTINSTLLGEHQLYPLLAGAAVAYQEGLDVALIKKGLEQYEIPNGRGKLITGRRNISIVDDTYNSSPEAVKAGLRMLRSLAGDRRVVAILGSMNELGKTAEEAHRSIGTVAGKTVDFLVAVGPFAPLILEGAQKAGLKPFHLHSFTTPEQLMGQINQVILPRDLVYIKASQNGMRLERVVQLLMAKPAQAKQLLVRQHGYWEGKA